MSGESANGDPLQVLSQMSPAERDRALRPFVGADGRLVSIPVKQAKKLVVLDWLAQAFEPGRHYSEREVNELLVRRHPDTAALRRALVDHGFLDRSSGDYWRCGGSIDV